MGLREQTIQPAIAAPIYPYKRQNKQKSKKNKAPKSTLYASQTCSQGSDSVHCSRLFHNKLMHQWHQHNHRPVSPAQLLYTEHRSSPHSSSADTWGLPSTASLGTGDPQNYRHRQSYTSFWSHGWCLSPPTQRPSTASCCQVWAPCRASPLLPDGRKQSQCKHRCVAAPQMPGSTFSLQLSPSMQKTAPFQLCQALAALLLTQSKPPFPKPGWSLLLQFPSTYLHLDNHNSSLFNFNFYWFLRHSFLRCMVSLDYTV